MADDKVVKQLWDDICSIENRIGGVKGIVQNPSMKVTNKEIFEFNNEIVDIIGEIKKFQREVIQHYLGGITTDKK